MPEEIKYKSKTTGLDRKVINAAKGGVAGAVIGGIGICKLVNDQLTLSDSVESYVCIAIMLLSVAGGVLGAGYFTRPSKDDGAVVDK